MFTTFPTLCPNLQDINLYSVPRDPVIAAAVSEFLLATNRDALRYLRVDSLLTEEACEVLYKLPTLCELSVVVEGSTSLPTLVLPNLTSMDVEYDYGRDWLQGFCGATLGRLGSFTICATSKSAQIGDFLEEFRTVALTTSAPNTLSLFRFNTSRPWKPSYSPLLAFEQLTTLDIEFSCRNWLTTTLLSAWHKRCRS
jgi:hypothetical protein